MRRLGPEEWSGLAMLVVCAGIGIPVVLGAADPDIPAALWVAVYTAWFVAIVAAAALEERRGTQRAVYAVSVVLSWVVVVTVPGGGLLPVLLVVVAAVGTEVVRLPASLVVVALNTVVIGITLARGGNDATGLLVGVGFYALIQVASVFSVAAIRREQQLRRDLAEAHVEQQTASVLLADAARTAERLRISRELHDLIGHQLTVLTLELEAARHRPGEAAREHVERAGRVARELLGDVRATVGELRTAPATDLREALRSVGRDVPGLDVAVEVDDAVQVDEEQTAALVRAMQEIVTNTLRHAGARELWVEVARDGEAVTLTAVDDGRGAATPIAGNGLRGLAERFAALGGAVDYDGRDGFRVLARVPAR
ncbi:sensor histidine kinase [Jiangella endophytica]|uniref:sensor histidine kinase n=1 Tax=Jiangella endophytica TaxID=1623398 RepID=UPI0018E589CC|nr:histidine kinase [Jiangella endophytica]